MSAQRRATAGAALTLALSMTGATLSAAPAEPGSGTELFRLANGMRWIAAPLESPGELTLLFYVATGSADESSAARGAMPVLVELWRVNTEEALAAKGAAPTAFYANPDFAVARATWPTTKLAEAVSFMAAHWFKPDLVRFDEARAKAIAARDRALRGRRGLYWELCRAAYVAHPYGRPFFGEKGDLERLGADGLRDHLSAHLVPSNLVVVVTGDFDAKALRSAVEREFAALPAANRPRTADITEPVQLAERRMAAVAPVNGLAIGFHKGAGAAPDIGVWGVLLEVWKRRVEERAAPQQSLVRRFDAGQAPAMKSPNLVFALWETEPAADLPALEIAAIAEWERLGAEPVGPEELQEAKERLAGAPQEPDARTAGQHLADWLAMTGDFHAAFGHHARVHAVTAEQVLAVARDTLRPQNRTVVTANAAP